MNTLELTDFQCRVLPGNSDLTRPGKSYEIDEESIIHALFTFEFDSKMTEVEFKSIKYICIDYNTSPILSVSTKDMKLVNSERFGMAWVIEITTLSASIYLITEEKEHDLMLKKILFHTNTKELALICANQKNKVSFGVK
jgi:hypothetical protein